MSGTSATSIGSIAAKIVLDAAGFSKGAKQADKSILELGKKFGLFMLTARAMNGAITAVVSTFRVAAAHTLELEKQTAATRAVLEGTAEQMAEVARQASIMSTQTAFSAIEISRAQEFLAKAGMKANDVLALTPAIMNGAEAAGEGVASVAAAVTSGMASLSIEADQAGEFVDKLTVAANLSKADMVDFGTSLKYVGATAKQLGISQNDLLSNMMALRNAGFEASQAGSKLRNVLVNIVKPTAQGAVALDRLGISAATLSTTGLTGVVEQLEETSKAVDTLTFQKDVYTAFGKQTGPALMALMAQGTDAIRAQGEALNRYGEAAKIAEGKTDTLGASFSRLGNAILQVMTQNSFVGFLSETTKELNNATTAALQMAAGIDTAAKVTLDRSTLMADAKAIREELQKLYQKRGETELGKGVDLQGAATADSRAARVAHAVRQVDIDIEVTAESLRAVHDAINGINISERFVEEVAKAEGALEAFRQAQADARDKDDAAEEKSHDKKRKAAETLADQAQKLADKRKAVADKLISEERARIAKLKAEHADMAESLIRVYDNAAARITDAFTNAFTIIGNKGKGLIPQLLGNAGSDIAKAANKAISGSVGSQTDKAAAGLGIAAGTGGAMALGLPPEAAAAVGSFVGKIVEGMPAVQWFLNAITDMASTLVEAWASVVFFQQALTGPLVPLLILTAIVDGLLAPFQILMDLGGELVVSFLELISIGTTYGVMMTGLNGVVKAVAEGMEFLIGILNAAGADIKNKTPGRSKTFDKFMENMQKDMSNMEFSFAGFGSEIDRTTESVSKLNSEISGLTNSFRLRRRIAEATTGGRARGGSNNMPNMGPSNFWGAGLQRVDIQSR